MDCFKASKTLSGIETISGDQSDRTTRKASKPLKPFQGLKHLEIDGASQKNALQSL